MTHAAIHRRVIRKANLRAQRRLRAYLDDPSPARWELYVESEDRYDDLRGLPRLASRADVDAAHDAADWRLAEMTGDYTAGVGVLPDVPLALMPDPGDHYLRPTGTAA